MRALVMPARFESFLTKAGLVAAARRGFRRGTFFLTASLAWRALLFAGAGFLTLPAAGQTNNAAAYTWTTFAGTSGIGSADNVGENAQFNLPAGVGVDSNGNVYVADTDNDTIRKITPAGLVSTIAGFPGTTGSADGLNSAARFYKPVAVTVDGAGNLYVVDNFNSEIREVAPVGTNWVVSTIAGFPQFDQFGDPAGGSANGMGTNARFNNPTGITVDQSGNLYVADKDNYTIRKLKLTGTNWVVSTIAGSAGNQGGNDGQNGAARFSGPYGITADSATNLYVADNIDGTVRKLTPQGTNWEVTTIAGLDANSPFLTPEGIAVDSAGNLFVSDHDNYWIVEVSPSGLNYVATVIAGQIQFNAASQQIGGSADGTGTNALFYNPTGIVADSAGNLYVADTGNNQIRKITTAVVVTTLAGLAASAGNVDNVGGAARFFQPTAVTVDGDGTLYVTDSGNETIRKITSEAEVTTLAGSITNAGSTNGAGNNAEFNNPYGIAVDGAGNLYVADQNNDEIRKVTPAGIVSSIAGKAGTRGSTDGSGGSARFYFPSGVALDASTNIYVSDSGNNTIRKMTLVGTNWSVTTLAGGFSQPYGLAVDGASNIFVADSFSATIRKITPAGAVSTIAGLSGNYGVADGIGTNAQFYSPVGVAVDQGNNLYVVDNYSSTIRKLTPLGTNWVVSTIGGQLSTIANEFGTPIGGSADGSGSAALFYNPQGIAVDGAGNLYVADFFNNTIRKGTFTAYGPANAVASTLPLTGALSVTLLPPEANGQWRFPWETAWRNSGFTATNLAAGNYPVEFRNLAGWLAIPPRLTLTNPVVVAASGISQVTNFYFPTGSPADAGSTAGSLTVYLGANPPSGAGWRFLGDTNAFFASNFTTNLLPGTYLLEFAGPFSGRATPANASVQVFAGQPTLISVSYPFAAAPPGGALLPTPVPANNISDAVDFPFAFNGQLQSDVGFGSGVVVQSNVVLTAAHLVFDDQTQSYVSGAYFFLQENVPAYVPSPIPARGWYLLSGYAAQRTNDLSSGNFGVDISSPQSRNLDVAAVYFQSLVAGGGYGGYLPSDEVPNQWLAGTAEKMLVGYPVDGSQFGFANIVPGTMYQIGPQPYPLTLENEFVTGQQEVYAANWFLSYPGNSGGPLYVQLNGYYYPAGVYLGTLNGQSVVRAIDSSVTNLIGLAATLGDSGPNNNGGGVLNIIPNQTLSVGNPGYLQMQLAPPSAVQAGAAWLLQPGTTYSSLTNFTQVIYTTNAVSLQFRPIPGWDLPTNQSVVVVPGIISHPTAFYTVFSPKLIFSAQGIGLTGTTNTTYRIEKTTSLKNPVWTGLTTNTIISPGFNLVVAKTNIPTTTFYRAVWLNR